MMATEKKKEKRKRPEEHMETNGDMSNIFKYNRQNNHDKQLDR